MRTHHRFPLVVFLLGLLVIVSGSLAAEEPEAPYETYPEALGGFFGPFSGSGLHYQKWLGESGFHVTGGVIYVPFDDTGWWAGGTTLDYAVGGEYQRRVYGEAFTDWLAGSLYLFAGGMHRGYIPVVETAAAYFTTPGDDTTWVEPVYGTGSFQAEVTAGAGIGVEIILLRHFSLPLEFGYGATWTVTEPTLADAFTVGPNVQTGLRYRY